MCHCYMKLGFWNESISLASVANGRFEFEFYCSPGRCTELTFVSYTKLNRVFHFMTPKVSCVAAYVCVCIGFRVKDWELRF